MTTTMTNREELNQGPVCERCGRDDGTAEWHAWLEAAYCPECYQAAVEVERARAKQARKEVTATTRKARVRSLTKDDVLHLRWECESCG